MVLSSIKTAFTVTLPAKKKHDEGVLAAALVGQLERLAVLVQHGQTFEDVAFSGVTVTVTVSPLDADLGDTVTVPCFTSSTDTE